MPKGLSTQGVCILLSKPTTLDAIIPLLSEFQIARRIDEPSDDAFGGSALIIPFRPEVNGLLKVDIRNKPWPDHMGDPKSEPTLFGVWSMGFYGPFAFPGNLQRAQQQLWTWREGKGITERHTAFLQVCTSYVFGVEKDAPVMPPKYDALAELQFVTKVALALLKHPDALAYFNPNGEILADETTLRKSLDYHAQNDIPPFDIWSNVRLFNPNNGWMIMDTVGMGQLDLPDLEACVPGKAYDLSEVARFLRNCCLYLLKNGEVVKHKNTMNGPGKINWQAHHVEKALSPPPRRLIRWFPMDGSKPPPDMLPQESKPSFLGRLFGR